MNRTTNAAVMLEGRLPAVRWHARLAVETLLGLRDCAVVLVLLGLCCSASIASDELTEAASDARQIDSERGGNRDMRPANAPRRRDVQESEPIYGEAPGAEVWGEGGDGWSENWGEGCQWCDQWLAGGCPLGHFWGRAEALYWSVQGSDTPPLVTTSPAGTSQTQAGVLPAASILFGQERLNSVGRAGGRFTVGYWGDLFGIEDTFLYLDSTNQSFFASSSGTPILARPFADTQDLDPNNNNKPRQHAFLLAFPNVSDGNVSVKSTTNVIYGNELNLRYAVYADGRLRFDVLVGYRMFQLSEALIINTNTTSLAGGTSPVGTQSAIRDAFDTQNWFNGGQIGFKFRETNQRLLFEAVGKVAVGIVAERVRINGTTVTTAPGGAVTTQTGGVLALPSNIGTHRQTEAGILPELDLNLGYQLTPVCKVVVGYTVMLLSNVVRPGGQIDLQVDPRQFNPPSQSGIFPAFVFDSSSIWLQGLNVGLECSF